MAAPHPPATLVDWLDDLSVRFLLNLPSSELSSVPRLCFQVEEAQWYYEDFVRPTATASGASPLPSLPLRQFCLLLFQHCPLLSGFTDAQHLAAYEEFLAYKVRVPVRGAILLDKNMEKVVLVRGLKKSASWSFPRGKINKDEKDLDCAIREVYEETGYDARQAGLVPENEDDAKYIDITMREQHMRLFVFRGVPEDTYFEPKTRKEISKIDWYSIKDLPGFKKQKTHHEGETSSANKFYMVAPFLGPLKKWINLQRKNDRIKAEKELARNGDLMLTGTEDEDERGVEVDEEHAPEVLTADKQSEDLRRLLSIGQTAQTAPPAPQLVPEEPPTNTLLAMLRGTVKPEKANAVPHTPLEQINPFPQQPETLQPDHLRHPSLAHQHIHPPPQGFPLSPQRIQQEQQRHGSLPTPNIFGPRPNGFPQGPPSGFPGMAPPHIQQQQQYQQGQSMPGPPPSIPFGQNGIPFNGPPQPPHMQHPAIPQHMPAPFQQPPPNIYRPQSQQGAIDSGPAVPNASQLPPPRLNAQSMKLLDAFKAGANRPAAPTSPSTTRTQRPASTHQTALLDLFKKPAVSSTPAEQLPPVSASSPHPQDEPISPTLTDVTVKPSKPLERKHTLNEITRTLPLKTKAKSPPVGEAPEYRQEPPAAPKVERERPKSRQLFDPSAPMKPLAANNDAEMHENTPTVLQQPPHPKVAARSPRTMRANPSGSPSRRNGAQNSGNQPTPPFTILARPGSAKGPQSPADPLSTDGQKAAFQPQVLKRPKAGDMSDTEQNKPGDKKDQLLALFGKAPSTTTTAPSTQRDLPPPEPQQPTHPPDPKPTLLNLFTTSTPSTTSSQQPTPPRAPRIEPERRPSSKPAQPSQQPQPTDRRHHHPQHQPSRQQSQSSQQSLLLDLFNRNANSSTPTTNSPGTPISPFMLGTPAVAGGMGPPPLRKDELPPSATLGRGSRLGSVTSANSGDGAGGGSGSGGATPIEAREFLRGFLDGVVEREGRR